MSVSIRPEEIELLAEIGVNTMLAALGLEANHEQREAMSWLLKSSDCLRDAKSSDDILMLPEDASEMVVPLDAKAISGDRQHINVPIPGVGWIECEPVPAEVVPLAGLSRLQPHDIGFRDKHVGS